MEHYFNLLINPNSTTYSTKPNKNPNWIEWCVINLTVYIKSTWRKQVNTWIRQRMESLALWKEGSDFKILILNSLHRIVTWVLDVKLWANVDPDINHRMTLLGQKTLSIVWSTLSCAKRTHQSQAKSLLPCASLESQPFHRYEKVYVANSHTHSTPWMFCHPWLSWFVDPWKSRLPRVSVVNGSPLSQNYFQNS